MLVRECRTIAWTAAVTGTVTGAVAGVWLGATGVYRHTWVQALTGTTMLTLSAVVGAVLVMQHLFAHHARSLRADLDHIEEQRRLLEVRENRVDRKADITQLRILGISQRLDETYTALAAERRQRGIVQRELRELTDEYNGLVQETLQARAETFNTRTREQSVVSISRARVKAPAPVARGEHDHA